MANSEARPIGRPFLNRWKHSISIVLDVLFVLVLPVACLLFDPGIIAIGPLAPDTAWAVSGHGFLSTFQLPLYVLFMLLVLGFWLSFLPNLPSILFDALRGAVFFGIMLSGLFAVMMVPAMLAAAIMYPVLAPFGVVPVLTALRYYRRHNELELRATRPIEPSVGVVAGVAAPIALAAAITFGVGNFLEPSFEQLRAKDSEIVLSAVNRLAENPLCLSHCRKKIVTLYCGGEIQIPPTQFVPLFEKSSGYFILMESGKCIHW